jgi:hypothetical protein
MGVREEREALLEIVWVIDTQDETWPQRSKRRTRCVQLLQLQSNVWIIGRVTWVIEACDGVFYANMQVGEQAKRSKPIVEARSVSFLVCSCCTGSNQNVRDLRQARLFWLSSTYSGLEDDVL